MLTGETGLHETSVRDSMSSKKDRRGVAMRLVSAALLALQIPTSQPV